MHDMDFPSLFLRASLWALVRAELAGRTPARFTGAGQQVWQVFRNQLDAADLILLAIEDAGAAMPLPFDPGAWWDGWPAAGAMLAPAVAEAWIAEALAQADLPQEAYLRAQAAALGVPLPAGMQLEALPLPAPHERWLELPGTGGWIAYTLCTRPEAALYFWENFAVICASPEELLLAGLIAWELHAPPRTRLPLFLDDADLSATLARAEKYHAVVGRRDLHGRRDLRVLHAAGEHPLWL